MHLFLVVVVLCPLVDTEQLEPLLSNGRLTMSTPSVTWRRQFTILIRSFVFFTDGDRLGCFPDVPHAVLGLNLLDSLVEQAIALKTIESEANAVSLNGLHSTGRLFKGPYAINLEPSTIGADAFQDLFDLGQEAYNDGISG